MITIIPCSGYVVRNLAGLFGLSFSNNLRNGVGWGVVTPYNHYSDQRKDFKTNSADLRFDSSAKIEFNISAKLKGVLHFIVSALLILLCNILFQMKNYLII